MTFKSKNPETKFFYRRQWTAYLMLIPGFLMITTFVIVPLIMSFVRSFFFYNDSGTINEFVGFDNYTYILTGDSSLFFKTIGNVCLLTLIITTLTVVLSFLFAIAMKALNNKFASVAKVVVYIPFLISGVSASIMFAFIFNYRNGIINSIRYVMGIDPINFQLDGIWPYLLIIIPSVWLGFGYNSLVMYSGLMNIPKSYYESADIDGAGFFRKLFRITIPNMKNYFVLLIVSLITGNLQMYEIPLMMTGGQPQYSTYSPVMYITFLNQSTTNSKGQAIAASILFMIPIVIINALVFFFIRSGKSEDA